jgi:hypothetical protein
MMVVKSKRSAWLALLALPLLLSGANAESRFEEMPVAGGIMLIDWNGDYAQSERDKLKTWLVSTGETVTLLHGNLPRQTIRIELTAYPSSSSAVPFARVLRREPQGIEFFVNPTRPLSEFIKDWTAYHELSHLFIPFPGDADIWFSEGLASYYQNVLQYRAGLLTEKQTWQKLHDGFIRGGDATDDELTLAELSPRMRERGAFMRVYWSGALYFLEADVALRARSNGQVTLDSVLRDFGECCLAQRQRWDGGRLAAEFDRIAASDIFRSLYASYADTTAIPDFEPVLAAAGVEVDAARIQVTRPGFFDASGYPAETRAMRQDPREN